MTRSDASLEWRTKGCVDGAWMKGNADGVGFLPLEFDSESSDQLV